MNPVCEPQYSELHSLNDRARGFHGDVVFNQLPKHPLISVEVKGIYNMLVR